MKIEVKIEIETDLTDRFDIHRMFEEQLIYLRRRGSISKAISLSTVNRD